MDIDNLKASDLFANVAPANYVAVKLSSVGKLGLPAVVHVKDYSFDDAMLMSRMNEQNENSIILQIIKNVVFEDIDLEKVTKNDAIEIMLSILGTWYSPTIEGFKYIVDETLPLDKRFEKENISVASIPVNALKTVSLPDEFKAPITIKNDKISVVFDYPRMIHDVAAKAYLDEKYYDKDNQFADMAIKYKSNTLNALDTKLYKEYLEDRDIDYLKTVCALQIISVNGKTAETLAEKFELLKEIPNGAIKALGNVVSKYNFGVQEEVTFMSDVTLKPVTRRFSFRFIDLLSALKPRDDEQYSISFSD